MIPLQNSSKPDTGGRIAELWLVHDGRQWVCFCPDVANVCTRGAHEEETKQAAIVQLMNICNYAAAAKERIAWTPRARAVPPNAKVTKLRLFTHEAGQ